MWCQFSAPRHGWDAHSDRVTGTLTVGERGVGFESCELRWETTHVLSVSFGLDPVVIPPDWIVMELVGADGATYTVYLRDGGWLGYRASVLGTMRRLQRELAAFRVRCGETGTDTKALLGTIGVPGEDPISRWFQTGIGRFVVVAIMLSVAALIYGLLVTR